MTNPERSSGPGRPSLYGRRMVQGLRPRLPAHVADALNTESQPLGWSRSALMRHYLLAGMRQWGHDVDDDHEAPDAPAS